MLTFTEAASAVRCALELDRRATAEPRFPAVRSGIHYGAVLYRDGDYVGATMNLASRVADEAGRHHVVVTGAGISDETGRTT
jgi:class 3 adenylate cyclase